MRRAVNLDLFLPLTPQERARIWRTSEDNAMMGDHPKLHTLEARYEVTVRQLEQQLESLTNREAP